MKVGCCLMNTGVFCQQQWQVVIPSVIQQAATDTVGGQRAVGIAAASLLGCGERRGEPR